MKQRLIYFVAGFAIYGVLGFLLAFMLNDDMPNKWRYIIIWAVSMSLFEMFVITPLRKKLTVKKEAKQ